MDGTDSILRPIRGIEHLGSTTGLSVNYQVTQNADPNNGA